MSPCRYIDTTNSAQDRNLSIAARLDPEDKSCFSRLAFVLPFWPLSCFPDAGEDDFKYSDNGFHDPDPDDSDVVYVANEDGGRHTRHRHRLKKASRVMERGRIVLSGRAGELVEADV
jgi:hypothetical protein